MTKKFPLTNWSEKKAFTIKLGAVKKYHIAVFADPNCPWCKRFFEENTDKLNDLEIFVYLPKSRLKVTSEFYGLTFS